MLISIAVKKLKKLNAEKIKIAFAFKLSDTVELSMKKVVNRRGQFSG